MVATTGSESFWAAQRGRVGQCRQYTHLVMRWFCAALRARQPAMPWSEAVL